jgi:serine/threonine protein kinase/predicted ATPase
MTPESIGRYKIERRIGRGGMAIIYLAHDPLMKRLVAIKLLPRQLTFDPTFRARFQREVEVIAALEHPAIVPVHDFGEQDEQPYFVMRYMPGGSLIDRLRYGNISLPDSARLVGQIALALDEAHRKGVIHRDIKPGNILFDGNDNAYLSDFGIVKVTGESATFTGNNILGTPSYMSPELARGDADVDGTSDIYALGVLIFRMWAGVLPYTANTPLGIAMKHITEPIPRILDYKPELPPDCDTLISIAMAKDRKDRFKTATELSHALERIVENEHLGDRASSSSFPIHRDKEGQKSALEDSQSITDPGTNLQAASLQAASQKPSQAVNNLPTQPSSFIGRRNELSLIADRLADPACRLLTLLGPGGIGKTRLAIQAARQELYNYQHGVFFAALAPLSSPQFIISTLAETINFAFYNIQEDNKVQLINYLRNKNMLLLLDNFEHLINAADLVSEILQNAPEVKFLITSRERLNLQEEWVLNIPGMQVPSENDFDSADEFAAMQLFSDRARRVKPGIVFSETDKRYAIRICQLLEGVPLGIELAAAWVRLLSTQEIATEIEQNLDFLTTSLRNVSQRHRSLRAVFEYSWNLLTETERDAFSKLTIFRGGFTRQAASKVAETSLFHLSTLVDKSLLKKIANDRYDMLEVLKQYGEEKLVESPQVKSQVESLHSEYFSSFLHQREDALKGGDQKTAIDEIGAEIENIRLAVNWAITNRRYAMLSQAIEGFYRYFEIRGWLKEGADILSNMSDSLRERYGGTEALDEEMLLHYSRVLARLGAFYYRLGSHTEAENALRKGINVARPLDARSDLAFALTYLGAVAYLQQNFEQAREQLNESLKIYREIGDQLGMAIALHHLGLVAREDGDLAHARQLFQESLDINREVSNRFGVSISLDNLGIIARELDELKEAQRLHEESLAIRKEYNDRWGIATSLDGLGQVALEMGNLTQAQVLFEESADIFREIGDQRRLERTLENIEQVNTALRN